MLRLLEYDVNLFKRPRIFSELGTTSGLSKLTGSVAKNIFTTFYSGIIKAITTISCVASEFLQQSPIMLLISFTPYSIRQHPHETEHAIIDKMRKDSADHQIHSWIGEMQDFDTVAWLQAANSRRVF